MKNTPSLGEESSRRDFIRTGLAVAVATATTSLAAAPATAAETPPPAPGKGGRPLPHNPRTAAAMPVRNLGKTGYRTGIFSLGCQAAVEEKGKEDIAEAILNRAIDLGGIISTPLRPTARARVKPTSAAS